MQKRDKYIDLSQFVFDEKNNKVLWKESIGIKAKFYYDNIEHTLVVTNVPKRAYLNVIIDDDIVVNNIPMSTVKTAHFGKYFYKPKYYYEIGQIVNGVKILEHTFIKRTKVGKEFNIKAYKYKCMADGYIGVTEEESLRTGRGCLVCGKNTTIAGINDIKTKRPDLVKYFVDEQDAEKCSAMSNKRVYLKCPECGALKYGLVSELSIKGFSCPMCSDGISYPNKFARNLFCQLSDQYDYYEYEWSPDWAGKLRYDNYIELKNGQKIIVEMDGGQHYRNVDKFDCVNNDSKKDLLAKNHNIEIIRINCDYVNYSARLSHIKENTIQSLGDYFDLENIDWDKCDVDSNRSIVVQVAEEYNKERVRPKEIARKLNIPEGSVYAYLKKASELGLCDYKPIRHKPICVYDENSKKIFYYESATDALNDFQALKVKTIQHYARNHKKFKNYIFRYATYEEYEEYLANQQAS